MFRKIAMLAVPAAAFALILCATDNSASQAFARGKRRPRAFLCRITSAISTTSPLLGQHYRYGWGYPYPTATATGYSYPTYCSYCDSSYSGVRYGYPCVLRLQLPAYYGWGYGRYGHDFDRNFGHNFGHFGGSRGGRR